MIDTVQRLMERNARNLFNEREMEQLQTPEYVNEYVAETDGGLVVATRTQHRLGADGSGGGFKVMEATPSMSLEEIQRQSRQQSLGLGTLMTLKGDTISLDLPEGYGIDFGGAKGVMYVPEGSLDSRATMDGILDDYVITQAGKGVLGIGVDRHAPDMNTGAADMDRMADSLEMITDDPRSRAAFSGKSPEAGGLEGREIATAQGLVYNLAKHLEALGRNPKETTAVVQGSGNVGYHFARLASEQLGVKIVGISDRFKAVVSDADTPLRIDDSVKFNDRLIDSWDEEAHTVLANPDDLLGMEVDVLVFAAAPDAVTEAKGNKEKVCAKIILEGANNPMDEAALDYYLQNGTSIVAGVLANVGGFTASNFEYNQGMTGVHWPEATAMSALKRVIDDAYENVLAEAGGNPHNMVDPVFSYALKRRYERDSSGLLVAAARR